MSTNETVTAVAACRGPRARRAVYLPAARHRACSSASRQQLPACLVLIRETGKRDAGAVRPRCAHPYAAPVHAGRRAAPCSIGRVARAQFCTTTAPPAGCWLLAAAVLLLQLMSSAAPPQSSHIRLFLARLTPKL